MKQTTKVFIKDVLEQGYEFGKFVDIFLEPYRHGMHGAANPEYYRHLRAAAYQAQRHGHAKFISKNGKKFLRLTEKGELRVLLEKSKVEESKGWDGRWRTVFFDIPVEGNKYRDQLRRILKQLGYYPLQASVYVSPHPINREGIAYLKRSGLIGYIRFGRMDELDNDRDLRKIFRLRQLL